jgi:hypothetical protein
MRLADLPAPYDARVAPAFGATAWTPHCGGDAHKAQWLAWNVREDAWHDAGTLDAVARAIDAVPGADGPNLLLFIAPNLLAVRPITPAERACLPATAATHRRRELGSRYAVLRSSRWDERALHEVQPGLLPGTLLRISILRRVRAWLTFDTPGRPVPRDPDAVLRGLGLPWSPGQCPVVRLEIPLGSLPGAGFAIPTLFNALDAGSGDPQLHDWRARPHHEHLPKEPWGHARDLDHGGAGLPEILADITAAGTVNAVCLGVPGQDWGLRPYLSTSGPS